MLSYRANGKKVELQPIGDSGKDGQLVVMQGRKIDEQRLDPLDTRRQPCVFTIAGKRNVVGTEDVRYTLCDERGVKYPYGTSATCLYDLHSYIAFVSEREEALMAKNARLKDLLSVASAQLRHYYFESGVSAMTRAEWEIVGDGPWEVLED